MPDKPTSPNGSWWNHETDPSQLAQVSTAFAALQRERHSAGWRRNGVVLLGMVALVAALKLLAFP